MKTQVWFDSNKDNQYIVVVKWEGTFELKEGCTDVRQDNVNTLRFSHRPTKNEIVEVFSKDTMKQLLARPDWTDVRIVGISIIEPLTPDNIILK